MKKWVITLLAFPFVFAQEFEPIVTESRTAIPWFWIGAVVLLLLAVIYWWRKRKPSFERRPKKEEEVKWIGKHNRNYQWFIIVAFLFIILYLWVAPEENIFEIDEGVSKQPLLSPPVKLSDSLIEQPPFLDKTNKSVKVVEELHQMETLPSTAEKAVTTPAVSSTDAQTALTTTRFFLSDIFRTMGKANREGKDIQDARKLYGEANEIYYRAYLALNQGRVDESFILSQQAKEKGDAARAALSP